ncbi:MAG TPA: protein kinase [Pirellulales bacterium]|nr:protein kinase [Pirellulales bacterium]
MRGEPPEHLVSLLERLGLASAERLRTVAPRVRRLADNLSDFESVWVDALAQARMITPFQASQINAGRGESLIWGPYVITDRLTSPGYAACFAARRLGTTRGLRLYVAPIAAPAAAGALRAAGALVERLRTLATANRCVIEDVGLAESRLWAVCAGLGGITAADRMAENGRFPPPVVLHIARQMLSQLSSLETLGVAHGDISAAGLLLDAAGQITLPMPGLRAIVRPAEGFSFDDLPPAAYDYLAPERIAEGVPSTSASDIYACGCLWWHLLTGRPPFGGGNSLAKLKAVYTAKLADVRQLAPEVPDVLVRAIHRCVAREPAARAASIADLSTLLGVAARGDKTSMADCLRQQPRLGTSRRHRRGSHTRGAKQVALGGAIVVSVACLLVGMRLHVRGEKISPQEAQTSRAAAVRQIVRAQSSQPPVPISRQPNTEPVVPEVTLAAAIELADAQPDADLVLSDNQSWHAESLVLKSGQKVRGAVGRRPRVIISRGGLLVECDDVCFENIDFVWDATADGSPTAEQEPRMFVVTGQSVRWQGCSLTTTSDVAPVAVCWQPAANRELLDPGELTFSDCAIRGMQAVVDCVRSAGFTVQLRNVLCVASGPIVRLERDAMPDGELTIVLDHTTTRGDSSVLEWRYGPGAKPRFGVAISVTDSALATNPRGALLAFVGRERPDRLLNSISWRGHGSLTTPDVAMATWTSRPGKRQALEDDALEVGGLVRSSVQFSGGPDGAASASRLTRWQVPLRSDEPPGINSNSLNLSAIEH